MSRHHDQVAVTADGTVPGLGSLNKKHLSSPSLRGSGIRLGWVVRTRGLSWRCHLDVSRLQSSEGSTEAGGPAFKKGPSHSGRLESPGPHHVGLSTRLLECPDNMAAGFPRGMILKRARTGSQTSCPPSVYQKEVKKPSPRSRVPLKDVRLCFSYVTGAVTPALAPNLPPAHLHSHSYQVTVQSLLIKGQSVIPHPLMWGLVQ